MVEQNDEFAGPTLTIMTRNWSANVGGVTRIVSELLNGSNRRPGRRTVLVAPDPGATEAGGVAVSGHGPRLAVSGFRALNRVCPCLIQVNDDFHLAIGAALYRLAHPRACRLVYSIHTLQDRRPLGSSISVQAVRRAFVQRLRDFVHAIVLRCSDSVVVLTGAMRDQMSRVEAWGASDRLEVIPFGVEDLPATLREATSDEPSLGTNGRSPVLSSVGVFYHDWKVRGHEILIDAVSRLRAEYPEILLLIVGDGHYRQRLERRIEELGLAEHVKLLGFVPDSMPVLKCTDIYAHLALCEAQGLAIVEAMLAGLPIVAANRGGIPEVVPDGEAALLVEPEPAAAADAIRRLLEDPELAVRLGSQARERALTVFSPRRTIEAYEAIFDRLHDSLGKR